MSEAFRRVPSPVEKLREKSADHSPGVAVGTGGFRWNTPQRSAPPRAAEGRTGAGASGGDDSLRGCYFSGAPTGFPSGRTAYQVPPTP
ncbi:hypothetical protein GCM10017779_21080 [Streptomyces capillispiralis]|nr:hypothetical protein GCM10017779_21080 [Streptomyces capillispiralis]